MCLIVKNLENPRTILEQGRWLAANRQLWQRIGMAAELQPRLFQVVEIQMGIGRAEKINSLASHSHCCATICVSRA